jgi:sulfopyruvate decarboxylase TPP-binding subunit
LTTTDRAAVPTGELPTVAQRVVGALEGGGVDLAIYLPDSVLIDVTNGLDRAGRIPTLVCSREDEGMAIAAGASLAGGLPVVLMEGSGIGYSGLILARAQVMRAGFLVIASHTPALGERFDYHAASRVVGAGVLGGLGIPYVIPRTPNELVETCSQALETVRGQRSVVGVLVPPAVLR